MSSSLKAQNCLEGELKGEQKRKRWWLNGLLLSSVLYGFGANFGDAVDYGDIFLATVGMRQVDTCKTNGECTKQKLNLGFIRDLEIPSWTDF